MQRRKLSRECEGLAVPFDRMWYLHEKSLSVIMSFSVLGILLLPHCECGKSCSYSDMSYPTHAQSYQSESFTVSTKVFAVVSQQKFTVAEVWNLPVLSVSCMASVQTL